MCGQACLRCCWVFVFIPSVCAGNCFWKSVFKNSSLHVDRASIRSLRTAKSANRWYVNFEHGIRCLTSCPAWSAPCNLTQLPSKKNRLPAYFKWCKVDPEICCCASGQNYKYCQRKWLWSAPIKTLLTCTSQGTHTGKDSCPQKSRNLKSFFVLF